MPRCLSLTPHRSRDELERRYRACRDPVERPHWQMVWLVSQGHTCPAVARLVGYSETWVRTVIHRYNDDGPAGLTDRRHANPGQPPVVPPAVREELRDRLAEPPPDGGLWTSPKVAAWLRARLKREIRPQRAWEVMRQIGFTLHQPRPRATTADPDAQHAFKKGGCVTPSMVFGQRIPRPR
ncbi:MAG: winged helix-turn-helix domain-containing protein [Chloroflexota bacterium]|nr:winged helix-turn-helix domain-containing protein [Chloroflexota bacterium]